MPTNNAPGMTVEEGKRDFNDCFDMVYFQVKYSKEDGLAVVSYLQHHGFKAELIGSLSKIGFSNHDIDVHVMNSGTREDREKLKELLLTSGGVDETDWGGMYFNNTQFGDVDIFFSIDDFDY